MRITYASVCSGIEAPSVAWGPLGWDPLWFSEIEPFPKAVLAHRHPDVEDRGDMTRWRGWDLEARPTVLVAGTPCQSFSIAGLRKGLDDDRGNLMLEALRLVAAIRPRWFVWENVPGVLSTYGRRAFGALLGGLAELGYGFAYRVLDAQFFGVPQRRRRVFVVGHSGGSWQRAAAVLFESTSLRGDLGPARTSREADRDPEGVPHGVVRGGLLTRGRQVSYAVTSKLAKGTGGFAGNETMGLLVDGGRVRRLTPRECERLQGFPDDYTLVPYRGKTAGPVARYIALGNSIAVPVLSWIGERIAWVEAADAEESAA